MQKHAHVLGVPIGLEDFGSGLYRTFDTNFEVVVADSPELIAEASALRYQVYCLERAYEDPARNAGGYERDEFDARSVHALVRHRASGACVGAVRLILVDPDDSTSAFPVETLCAGRFYDGVVERIRSVPRNKLAEISRFAVSKQFRRRLNEADYIEGISPSVPYFDLGDGSSAESRRIMPHVTLGLFAAVIRLSVHHGVTHWFAVMEPTLIRLLRQFGIHFAPIGPLVEYHGRRRPTFVVGAEVAARARKERSDVWDIVTNCGRELPLAP